MIIQDWEKIRELNPEILKTHTKLLNVFNNERQQEEARVQNYISGDNVESILKDVWTSIHNASWAEDSKQNALDFSTPRLKKWYNPLYKGLKKSNLDTLEEIHSLRIINKKVRYVREFLDPIIE